MQVTPIFDFDSKGFLDWFEHAGGWVDRQLMDLVPIPGMGYGAMAQKDIPPDTLLFHIPDELILSAANSSLRQHLAPAEWQALDHGWCRLIVVMMWETVRGSASPWHVYLVNMPFVFDTPMFWSDAEKAELTGTELQGRIGKEDAEAQYRDHVKPIIDTHPELFPEGSEHTTLSAYHLHGSRILSRSFTVPASRVSTALLGENRSDNDSDSNYDDDDDDKPLEVVMIPLADMLNAAFERDNANLHFGENHETVHVTKPGGFSMKSTQLIANATQIYNTYASPPNSELLRKYGHVDVLPLDQQQVEALEPSEVGDWPYGNPGDEILIDGAQTVAAVAAYRESKLDDAWTNTIHSRLDWWLDDGQEDAFAMKLEDEIDNDLISFIRLLLYDREWDRSQKKGKIPSPVLDEQVAVILHGLLNDRLAGYPTNLSNNLAVVRDIIPLTKHLPQFGNHIPVTQGQPSSSNDANVRRLNAAIVKVGEQRILHSLSRRIDRGSNSKKKRKAAELVA